MKIRVLIFSALRNLKRNRKRSFLTMLGIIIGIAAVIAIVALGQAYKNKTIKDFTGEDSGEVVIMASFSPKEQDQRAFEQSLFNNNDKKLISEIKDVKNVEFQYSQSMGGQFITFDIRSNNIQGSASGVEKSIDENIIGRNLTKSDSESKKRVAVISESIIKGKFENSQDLIGSVATIEGLNYEIVGIIKSEDGGSVSFSDMMKPTVQIPKKTFDKYLAINKIVYGLKVTLNKEADVKTVTKDIADKLNSEGTNREKGKYTAEDSSGIIKMLGSVLNTITTFIAAVAGISLFIAGIGVMNMIYTSVSERTAEIGIKRALGAKKKDIKREFLIEGIIITMTGGIIGYILGLIIAIILSIFLKMKVSPSLLTVSIAMGISILVGVASSFLPAKKAANQNTVDILK